MTEVEWKERWAKLIEEPGVETNSLLKSHLQTLQQTHREWALWFRSYSFLRGHNTNAFQESAMNVLKSMILNRQKCYNVVELVEHLAGATAEYESLRLLQQSYPTASAMMFLPDTYKLTSTSATTAETVTVLRRDDGVYAVGAEIVDISLGVCTCNTFELFCEHQKAVIVHTGGQVGGINIPPCNPLQRRLLAFVACGRNTDLDIRKYCSAQELQAYSDFSESIEQRNACFFVPNYWATSNFASCISQ